MTWLSASKWTLMRVYTYGDADRRELTFIAPLIRATASSGPPPIC
ncbi:MAG: hypothetical protein OXG37_10035 [Actinomycetia bacterium]|nr:hypothetical protein [Actinomycetes bacterium]